MDSAKNLKKQQKKSRIRNCETMASTKNSGQQKFDLMKKLANQSNLYVCTTNFNKSEKYRNLKDLIEVKTANISCQSKREVKEVKEQKIKNEKINYLNVMITQDDDLKPFTRFYQIDLNDRDFQKDQRDIKDLKDVIEGNERKDSIHLKDVITSDKNHSRKQFNQNKLKTNESTKGELSQKSIPRKKQNSIERNLYQSNEDIKINMLKNDKHKSKNAIIHRNNQIKNLSFVLNQNKSIKVIDYSKNKSEINLYDFVYKQKDYESKRQKHIFEGKKIVKQHSKEEIFEKPTINHKSSFIADEKRRNLSGQRSCDKLCEVLYKSTTRNLSKRFNQSLNLHESGIKASKLFIEKVNIRLYNDSINLANECKKKYCNNNTELQNSIQAKSDKGFLIRNKFDKEFQGILDELKMKNN